MFSPHWTLKTNSENQKSYVGILKDIYDSMKTLIDNFDYEVEFQPNGTFGSKLPDGTFNGMVGSLMRNETDIGGPLLVTEERNKAVEFSVPFSIFQYGLMSGTVETQKHPFLIFDIFELPVWLTLFASVVFMAAAATVVYYGVPFPNKRRLPEVFSKYLWAFQISLITSFGGDERWFIRHLINSPSFRLLQLLWFAGPGLVCLYSYQGGIISAFAANKIKTKFESLDDLKQYQSAKAMALSGSAITRFFESLTNTPSKYEYVWDRMKDSTIQYDVPGSVPPWMDIINKGKACVVGESYHMKTRIGDRFFKTGKCGLRVSDIDLQSSYVALAFRKEYRNTDLVKKFNRGVRRFNEGSLGHFSLLRSNLYYDKCAGENTSVTKPLTIKDFLGTFLILITGTAASLVVFTLELYVSKRLKSRPQKYQD